MTKSELIQEIASQNPQMNLRDIERVVNAIFQTISSFLSSGNRVELRGFGTFSLKERKARQGRNPKTGDLVPVEAKRLPHFKTGKELRARLNTQRSN